MEQLKVAIVSSNVPEYAYFHFFNQPSKSCYSFLFFFFRFNVVHSYVPNSKRKAHKKSPVMQKHKMTEYYFFHLFAG